MIQLQQVGLNYYQYARPVDAIREWFSDQTQHHAVPVLQDISFSLPKGGALGIVGDNGAGKSSLLKIVAGILPATTGQCYVMGQCSALLELGAGLQMEASAYDNIQLGLALRGLSHPEIRRQLPEVLAFAELQDHATQALKTYSSGMLVRLAFAIAVQVVPDVLIIDEALAVGDQYFQKKSLARIQQILGQGASLIFCSHNLYQVRELCQQALWLEKGQIKQLGKAQQVVDAYQDSLRQRLATTEANIPTFQVVQGQPYLQSVQLINRPESAYQTGQCFVVEVHIALVQYAVTDVHIGVVIRRNDGIQCYGISSLHDGITLIEKQNRRSSVRYIIPQLPLLAGEYCLEVWLIDATGLHVYDARERCCHFQVIQASQQQGIGLCQIAHTWEVV